MRFLWMSMLLRLCPGFAVAQQSRSQARFAANNHFDEIDPRQISLEAQSRHVTDHRVLRKPVELGFAGQLATRLVSNIRVLKIDNQQCVNCPFDGLLNFVNV